MQRQFGETFSFDHLETVEISEKEILGIEVGVDPHDQLLIVHLPHVDFITTKQIQILVLQKVLGQKSNYVSYLMSKPVPSGPGDDLK